MEGDQCQAEGMVRLPCSLDRDMAGGGSRAGMVLPLSPAGARGTRLHVPHFSQTLDMGRPGRGA